MLPSHIWLILCFKATKFIVHYYNYIAIAYNEFVVSTSMKLYCSVFMGHNIILTYTIKIPYSGKVWRIDSFRVFGEGQFGELIDQPIDDNCKY